MIAKTLGAAAVLALAGSASAQFLTQTTTAMGAKVASPNESYATARGTAAQTFKVDISNTISFDGIGVLGNAIMTIDIGTMAGVPGGPISMTGVGWNTFQSSVGLSWGSEMRMAFNDSANTPLNGFNLGTSGTGAPIVGIENNVSAGILDLTANLIPNLLLPDGILRIEFYESYDDVAGAVDGNWEAGSSITIAVPSPGAMGLLGLAGVAALGRKRR